MNIKNFTLALAFFGLSSIAIAQPMAPVLLSPADSASSVSRTPLLDWDTLTVDSFYIVLSDQSDLSTPIISMMGDSTSQYQIASALAYSTKYYWAVAGMDINGMGMFSDTFSFTTEAMPLNLPDDPTLKSPTTGALGVPKKPTLEWNVANGATQYRVHVAAFNNFGDTVYHAIVNGTSHTLTKSLDEYTVYYWRVVAENNDGLSNWSNFWNFTTIYTGIEGITRANFNMNLYPNPSTTNTALSFEVKQDAKALVQVLDLNGKVVQDIYNAELEAGVQEMKINTSALQSGVYFVQISIDGAAQMMKLIVN